MDDLVERTQAPTPRRLEEARLEGRVARSPDLTAAAMLLAGVLLLGAMATTWAARSAALVEGLLVAHAHDPLAHTAFAMESGTSILAPILIAVPLVGLIVGAIQTGFLFTVRPLAPRLSRLSPASGWRRTFSAEGAARTLMGLAKVIVAVAVAAITIYDDMPRVLGLVALEGSSLLAAAAWLVWTLALKIAAALLALALLDWVWQRYRHQREMQLSRPQMREELKRTEGEPLWRQYRRKIARQIATERAHGGLAGAHVLIVDRDGFAVALGYDQQLESPRVIARGQGAARERLQRQAQNHSVPVVERAPLARVLSRTVQVGQQIPPRLYEQVAQVLAEVYRQTGRRPA